MKTHIGQQHIAAPALKLGPTFPMSFVLTDIREVIVPPDEPDPEGYARQHFMIEFGLIGPNAPGTESAKAPDDNGSES
jgi:hypothetical protein